MSSIIDIKEIMALIPHRYPFLLIDKVVDLVPNESATGVKCVTINEEFFKGHFPGDPVMPGVLQIEAMAQTAAVMVIKSLGDKIPKNSGILFTTINNVKFRKPVKPGDVLEMKVKVVKHKMSIYTMKGEGFVDANKVIEAEFSALIYDKDKL